MTFTRTPLGLVNQFLFYRAPLLWVEGPDDVVPAEAITEGISCIVKSAGGIPNCTALVKAMKAGNLPFAVLIDGEFTVLRSRRSPHRRAVQLLRHSMENYYADTWVILAVCRRIAGEKLNRNVARTEASQLIRSFEASMERLVRLDVAGWLADDDRGFFPDKVEPMLVRGREPTCDAARVQSFESRAGAATLAREPEAATLLRRAKRLSHCIRGHVVFGFVRAASSKMIRDQGSKLSCDNAAFNALLADACWRQPEAAAKEHRSIKTRLRRAVREAGRLRGTP